MIPCDQCQHSVNAFAWQTKHHLSEHLFLDALGGPQPPLHSPVWFLVRLASQTAA